MESAFTTPLVLLLATRNAHKVAEIAAVLGALARCLSLKEFPVAPPVEEDADTFAGNAAKKAAVLAAWLAAEPGRAGEVKGVLADDSGLEVDALGGAPGVLSARFAALDTGATGNSSDADNNAKLLRLLAAVPGERRTARFRCALALAPVRADADRHVIGFEGACEGRMETAPRGSAGFGYDPLFVPSGFAQSFAELGEEVKNGISHRARALARLREWLGPRG
jgi:XTP/dITP diphosphohydrolase